MNKTRILLAVAGLSLLGAWGTYQLFFTAPRKPTSAASDPRREYTGPFRNVNPDVHYVSDQLCAGCHLDIAQSYAQHPMGRSVLPIAQQAGPPEDAQHKNPFDALDSRFTIRHDGEQVQHVRARLDASGKPVAELTWNINYVIGSGKHGHSYMTNQEGYLFQTPISWYSQKAMWNLSPGFGPERLTGRPLSPDCLFCHVNRAHPIEGSVNHYAEPVLEGPTIGCQRCHGPGELHVSLRERNEAVEGKVDSSIVNPRHLDFFDREAVCEQCHLEAKMRIVRRDRGLYDYRPGLPFERFWSVFVRTKESPESQRAVSHVEQMYESRCFQRSKGKDHLGCISCHDPHVAVTPAQRVSHYRARCLHCHEQQGCSLPQAERLRRNAQDSCIDCHMPRYGSSDIPHTASTDHRIPRAGKPSPSPAERSIDDRLPLLAFYRNRKETNTLADDRDLALALVRLCQEGDPGAVKILRHTLGVLDTVLQRDPEDIAAMEAKAYALGLQGRWKESLAVFEALLAQSPRQELALIGAARVAEALGQSQTAQHCWREAIAVNPWIPDYRRHLALHLLKKEAWEELQPQCEAWIRLDPMSTEARSLYVQCLLAAGRKSEAQAEFARIEALAPNNLTELRIKLEKRLK